MDGKRAEYFEKLASRYNVEYVDTVFRTWARPRALGAKVLTLAQCATLAMRSVVTHAPQQSKALTAAYVHKGLLSVAPQVGGRLETDVRLAGASAYHRFDFVLRMGRPMPICLKILRPTYGARVEVQRYGFAALDLERTPAGDWPRVAVVTKGELWKPQQLELVRRFPRESLIVNSDREAELEQRVPETVLRLVA